MSRMNPLIVGLLGCWLALATAVVAAEPAVEGARFVTPKKSLIVMGGSALAFRNSTKQDAEVAFNAVLDETVINPDMKLNVSVYGSTEELYRAFDRGEVDGIFGSPLEFMGRMEHFGEAAMALSYKGGVVRQSYVLLARKGESGSTLQALRDKTLTLASFQDVEELYLNTLLLRHGLPEIPVFFSRRLDAKNSNVSIMDVFFNKSDATVVRESEFLTAVELNPQIGRKLVVLDKSPPFLPALGALRKTFDREKVAQLMRDIERVSDISQPGKILALTQATAIVSIPRSELQSVIDLKREYQSLRSRSATSPAISQGKAKDKRRAP